MKQFIFIIILFNLIFSCKSTISKNELIQENQSLRERIITLESSNNVNHEAALEIKKMNVVYRGIPNPIYISKPNVLAFEATAPGLTKTDSLGNYNLNPGSGDTIEIKIRSKLLNGDSLTEIKTLRIKDIKPLIGTINGLGCDSPCILKLKKEELTNAKIRAKASDFIYAMDFRVSGFKIKMPHYRTINIEGNKMNAKANDLFTLLNPSDEVIIFDMKIYIPGVNSYRLKNIAPISIQIIE